jgi:hypothetical protein
VLSRSRNLPSLMKLGHYCFRKILQLDPTQSQRNQIHGLKPCFFTANFIKSSAFWDITPYSSLKVNRRFGGTYRLHLEGRRIRNQRENRWQAEQLIDFQWTTGRYIPEDRTLHNHSWENLKSNAYFIVTIPLNSPSTLRTRARHTLRSQPYGRKACLRIWEVRI